MEKIRIDRDAVPQVTMFRAGEGPSLEFDPDPENERYQILGLAFFDDGDLAPPLRQQLERAGFSALIDSPATIWFFPSTGDAFVQGRTFGELPAEETFRLPEEYVDVVTEACRPDILPNRYWTFASLVGGCLFTGHVYLYGFDVEGDQYKICTVCGRQVYIMVDEEDWEDMGDLARFPPPESLPERQSFYTTIIPLLTGTWQHEGSLIMYAGWHDGRATIVLVGEPFDSEPSRISVELAADELFTLLRDRGRTTGSIRLLAVSTPTGEGYFNLMNDEEWLVKIEWEATAQRLLTITFPATFEFTSSPGQVVFKPKVDRQQFFNALDAVRAAIRTAQDTFDQPDMPV